MDALVEEISSIRSVQHDLQRQLDRLGNRIDNVEATLACRRLSSSPPPAFAGFPPPPAKEEPEPVERESVPPPPQPTDSGETAFFKDLDETDAPSTPPPPLPEPATSSRQADGETLEMRLGQVWLVRIGIVVLLTGLVFLGNYAYHEFIDRVGAIGKLALMALAGGALSATGWWLQRRDAFRNFGRVLLGGGLATLYYTTYASHFVPTLRVISSPLLAGTLLLAMGGAFVWLADRIRSSLLAGTTIALAFYTAAINPIGNFSLFSNLVISGVGVVLLARRQWSAVSFLTLAGSYGAFAFWRLHESGSFVAAPEAFLPAVLFPAAYWIVHTAAVLWRRTPALDPAARPVYLTINNAAFFALVAPVVEGRYPGSLWICALGFGAVLLVLGVVAARTAPEEGVFDGSYLAQGLGLVFAALAFKLAGWTQPVAFALFAGTLLGISRLRHGGLFRVFAMLAAVISGVTAAQDIVMEVNGSRLVGGICAVLLTANARVLRSLKYPSTARHSDLEVLAHLALATLVTMAATSFGSPFESGIRLVALGITATFAFRIARLPELAIAGQALVMLGQLYFAIDAVADGPKPLWPVIAGSILVFWWQRQVPRMPRIARFWQSIHCIAPAFIGILAIERFIPESWQGCVYAGIALALIVAGFSSRAWPVSIVGGAFTVASILTVAHAIADAQSWLPQLTTLAVLHAQALAITALGHRAPVNTAGTLLGISRILRGIASVFAVWLLFVHAPAELWFVSLIAVGCLVLVVGGAVTSLEAVVQAAGFLTAGFAAWISHGATPAVWNFAAFAILIGSQRFVRSRASWLPNLADTILIAAATGGLWLLVHRTLTAQESGFLITIAWSLLTFGTLAAGFVWKERAYRLAGLFILASAVLRIVLVDVWALDTISRIVSFLVLGVVLIALSFLYNRHAAALRKWL